MSKPNFKLVARVFLQGGDLAVEVKHIEEQKSGSLFDMAGDPGLRRKIESIAELRRMAQKVLRGEALRKFRNDIFRLEILSEKGKKRIARGRYVNPAQKSAMEKLPGMKTVAEEIDIVRRRIWDLEDEILLNLYGNVKAETDNSRIWKLKSAWQDALVSWYCLKFEKPDQITLALYGDSKVLSGLAREYYTIFSKRDSNVKVFEMKMEQKEDGLNPGKLRIPENAIKDRNKQFSSILFEIKGRAVYPLYSQEAGVHSFFTGAKKEYLKCLVYTSAEIGEKYRVPENPVHRKNFEKQAQRIYKVNQGILNDRIIDMRFTFSGHLYANALNKSIENRFQKKIQDLLT